MNTFMALYPPQPDMAAFKAYYVEKHIPLARKIPGIKAIRYSMDIHPLGGDAQYACIFEADFDSIDSLVNGMKSPEGVVVEEDLKNFAINMPTVVQFAREV